MSRSQVLDTVRLHQVREMSLSTLLSRVVPAETTVLDVVRNGVAADMHRRLQSLAEAFNPDDAPAFPNDVVALADDGLGSVYSDFTSWSGYIRYLLNIKEADCLALKGLLQTARKAVIAELSDQPSAVRKDAADTQPAILSLERLLVELELEAQYLQAEYYWFDTCSKSLSREISRRGIEAERKSG